MEKISIEKIMFNISREKGNKYERSRSCCGDNYI